VRRFRAVWVDTIQDDPVSGLNRSAIVPRVLSTGCESVKQYDVLDVASTKVKRSITLSNLCRHNLPVPEFTHQCETAHALLATCCLTYIIHFDRYNLSFVDIVSDFMAVLSTSFSHNSFTTKLHDDSYTCFVSSFCLLIICTVIHNTVECTCIFETFYILIMKMPYSFIFVSDMFVNGTGN